MIRTSNPALGAKTFTGFGTAAQDNVMTLQGTVNKTLILLFLVLLSASWTWKMFHTSGQDFAAVSPWILGGAIGGFIVAMVTIFKKEWSPVTSPIYALLEGLLLGGLSAFFETLYPGIVVQAVTLTFGTLFCLLMAYTSGLIRPSENFKLGVVAATGAIGLFYFVAFILSFFGIRIPFIHEGGTWGIAFSVFVVIIAALNLVLDFDFIEGGTRAGAPKYMEWYGAFGLMVTLIWLYIEILRLLAKLRERR